MTSYKIHQEKARTVDMLYNLFQESRPEIIRSFSDLFGLEWICAQIHSIQLVNCLTLGAPWSSSTFIY